MKHFKHLFVFGRPAGGKSEFIDFMKQCEPSKRLRDFFIAPFDELDDYLFLTELADHEDIMQKLGVPRRLTERTSDGVAVKDDMFWGYAMERMNQVIRKKYLPNPKYYDERTLLIEFSRGIDHFSYKSALSLLDRDTLAKGAIIYVKVSFNESLRRNESRYQEKLKHSVLAHKCPEHIMNKYYREDDWAELTGGRQSGTIAINGVNIPFVTMENEPESKDPQVLEERYKNALQILNS